MCNGTLRFWIGRPWDHRTDLETEPARVVAHDQAPSVHKDCWLVPALLGTGSTAVILSGMQWSLAFARMNASNNQPVQQSNMKTNRQENNVRHCVGATESLMITCRGSSSPKTGPSRIIVAGLFDLGLRYGAAESGDLKKPQTTAH